MSRKSRVQRKKSRRRPEKRGVKTRRELTEVLSNWTKTCIVRDAPVDEVEEEEEETTAKRRRERWIARGRRQRRIARERLLRGGGEVVEKRQIAILEQLEGGGSKFG